jgi:DNA-binding CsgD family transcriptional regulator
MAAAGLIGRDEELAAISALLAERRPGGMVLSGEPGIGKTVLWEAGVAEARAAGWTVLQHRSVQAEAGLAFAGLSDLAGPVVDDIADALVAPRRRALEVALLLAEPGDAPPDSLAVGLAMRDALRLLARSAPFLIALDDVQWLDPSSATVLAVALRRVGDEPIAVLATQRTAPGEADPIEPFEGLTRRLELPGLELGDTHRLLHDGLGLDLARPVLAAIHRKSGGNPYFASELARAPDAGLPGSLHELLGGRLERLPQPTLDVLLRAAALSRPTVESLGADAELDVAVMERILRIDGSDVRFTHPLLATVVYDRAPPGKRRAVHARLAEAATDPEERVRHLSLAAGDACDDALADQLDVAARHAAARGATAAAAELMSLSIARTPTADTDALEARRLAAAEFHQLAGDLEQAAAILEEVLSHLPRGPRRAEVLYRSALTQRADPLSRTARCEEALEQAADDDGLAVRVLGFLAINDWFEGEMRRGVRHAREGLARAERTGDPWLLASAISRVGVVETWLLDETPGLLARGVELERTLPDPPGYQNSATFVLAFRQHQHDELEETLALVDELETRAARRGDEMTSAWCGALRVSVAHLSGDLAGALRQAGETLAVAEQIGEFHLQTLAGAFMAVLLADVGRFEDSKATAAEALRLARAMRDEDTAAILRAALGRAELAAGDLTAAAETLDGLPEAFLRMGHLLPSVPSPWPDALEVLVGVGELDRAATLQESYDDLARRSSRWARCTAARCRGLLRLARGDDTGAVAELELSLQEEGGTYPLERGRTLTALGMVHRHARRGRAARETLERAVALLDEMGAVPWCDKARDELKRVSGRRVKTDDGLTDAEQRVAELAAQGRKNKEIAATLFLAVGTVEMHLSRVYRKLGVRSRTELAGHVNAADPRTMVSPVSAADERT